MKKKIVLLFICLFFPIGVKAAGSATIGGSSQVEVGKTVTVNVTLKNIAAWNIRITSSGSTSGCSQSFADATSNGKNATKTLSVICKATSLGTIAFTVTGDITSADGSTNNVSLNKRVSVVPVREKATDAALSSLTVEGYSLTPTFQKDILEYSVIVPSTINSIKLDAKANEAHATVSGTGEFEVTEGMNTFSIVVTAENGGQKTYKVVVNVEDTNPIVVPIAGKDYTLIKNAKSLVQPDAYEEKTVLIDNTEIPAFYSEVTQFTLVGIKDEDGHVFLAIYDEEKELFALYTEIKESSFTFYPVTFPKELVGYIKHKIFIQDQEVEAYQKSEDSRFAIVYGMHIETGEYAYYSYDTKEGTFQVWDPTEVDALQKELKIYTYATYIFGGGLLFAFLLLLYLLSKGKGKKKKEYNNKVREKKVSTEKKEENPSIEIIDRREQKETENRSANEELFGKNKE